MHKETVTTHQFEKKFLKTTAVLWLILLTTAGIFAQDQQTKQYQPPKQTISEPATANSSLVISPDEDYLIGPSDVIEIKIEDAPELSGTFRLNAKAIRCLVCILNIGTSSIPT